MTELPAPALLTGRVRRGAGAFAAALFLLSGCGDTGEDPRTDESADSAEEERLREVEAAFLRQYRAEGGPLDDETSASSVFATAQDWCRWRGEPDVPEEQFFGEVGLAPEASGPLKLAADAEVCDEL